MFVNLYIEYYLLFSFHTFTFLTLTDASQKNFSSKTCSHTNGLIPYQRKKYKM